MDVKPGAWSYGKNSHPGCQKQGADENILTQDGWSDRRHEKTA
jgi:hypothetical protein